MPASRRAPSAARARRRRALSRLGELDARRSARRVTASEADTLRGPVVTGHSGFVDEEGIYRDEVMEIFGALADISSDTVQILAILRGEDEEDEDAEEEPLDS